MSEPEQRIRIAIVDDHEMFRAGVIATLQPHFDVVGQAADVEGSVAMIGADQAGRGVAGRACAGRRRRRWH